MWKQVLNVDVELRNQEWKVFIDTRIQKNYDIARHAYLVDFFDAASLLEMWLTGVPENVTGYSNAEYDRVMKASMREMDHAKRVAYLHEAEDILMKDMPVLPIYFYAVPYLQSARVKGIYISPRNWDFFRAAEIVE